MESKLIILLSLLTLLPFLGVFLNQAVVLLLGIISAGVLVSCALMGGSSENTIFFFSQFMLLLFWSVMSQVLIRRRLKESEPATLKEERQALRQLENLHGDFRTRLQLIEKDEERIAQIYAVARGLGESLSWSDMAPRLATGIKNIFGAFEFLLYAQGDEGRWIQLHRRGAWVKDPPIDDIPSKTCYYHPPKIEEVVPVLAVPVFNETAEGQSVRGILFVKQPSGTSTEEEFIQTGDEFGKHLSMAINKALLFHQMEMSSKTDGLTGVLRRQAFMERLNQEFKRSVVFQTPFSLMMIDIDHFKKVNDSHGHPAGDAVLAKLGEILKISIYETDVVGRFGGEEFIILFPKAEPDGVVRKAEALRQRIEREVIVFGFEKLKITVSMGLAHYPSHGRTAEGLIAQSDQALYRAKDSGRNRVVQA